MTASELLAAARASAQKQLTSVANEEQRLIMAYLDGVTAGGAVVHANTVTQLLINQSKL